MKGFCKSVTEEDYIFDREYYPDGMKNGRIYFRFLLFSEGAKSVLIIAEECVQVIFSMCREKETLVMEEQGTG